MAQVLIGGKPLDPDKYDDAALDLERFQAIERHKRLARGGPSGPSMQQGVSTHLGTPRLGKHHRKPQVHNFRL